MKTPRLNLASLLSAVASVTLAACSHSHPSAAAPDPRGSSSLRRGGAFYSGGSTVSRDSYAGSRTSSRAASASGNESGAGLGTGAVAGEARSGRGADVDGDATHGARATRPERSSVGHDVAGGSRGGGGEDVQGSRKAPAPKVSITGTWTGVSNEEKIVLKVGAAGSASLTNSGGANSGEWTPGAAPNVFSFRFGGRAGVFTLINSKTATLSVMGSTVELRR